MKTKIKIGNITNKNYKKEKKECLKINLILNKYNIFIYLMLL